MSTRADGFPPQIKYIVGNEACERFSYYGMRSILVVFMAEHLGMTHPDAKAVFHLFAGACYLTPVLGAYLSDRVWGKYLTIMRLSLLYCVGHGVLAFFDGKAGLYAGMALIALGAGGVKPCVSAFVGDQFTASNKHLVKRVFDIFYWSINFGSFFSTLIIPWMLPRFGPAWAFGLPGILMGIATFIFWLGRGQYVNVPPTGQTGVAGFLPVFFAALAGQGARKPGEGFFDAAAGRYSAADIDAAKAVGAIIKVFATITVFWALFDQHSSSWVLQAQRMDLQVLGMKLEASQISALNPIMVMGLIPVFGFGIYPVLERLGISMTPLRKIGGGMMVAALSFVAAGAVEQALDAGARLSVSWQLIQYLVITMAEVMVSITGLEFAYSQAPRSMKSTIMSLWFLAIFAGNSLTAYISKINVFQGASFFYFFAALMAAVTVAYAWIAARYPVRDHMEA